MATKKTTTAPEEQTEVMKTTDSVMETGETVGEATDPVMETTETVLETNVPALWHATVSHCTSLRLRTSPHAHADTKEILPVGTEVAILNDDYFFVSDGCNVWFHVEVTETHETGFVCGAFLTPVVGE